MSLRELEEVDRTTLSPEDQAELSEFEASIAKTFSDVAAQVTNGIAESLKRAGTVEPFVMPAIEVPPPVDYMRLAMESLPSIEGIRAAADRIAAHRNQVRLTVEEAKSLVRILDEALDLAGPGDQIDLLTAIARCLNEAGGE